jgi:photosystem II stability/assembly factor-like uncharacterized protein
MFDSWKDGWHEKAPVSGTTILAGTDSGGVFVSSDSGKNWRAVDSGLGNIQVYSLAANGSTVFAGTFGGVFLSTNGGRSWTAATSGIPKDTIISLAAYDAGIFAGTANGVFLSTDNGASWTAADSGLTKTTFGKVSGGSLVACGNGIFAGTNNGIFSSTDNGASWHVPDSSLSKKSIGSLAVSGATIFALTDTTTIPGAPSEGSVLLRSTNNGMSWAKVSELAFLINSLVVNGSDIFAMGDFAGVYLSSDSGVHWTSITNGLGAIGGLCIHGTVLFYSSQFGKVYRSTDKGTTWTAINNGLPTFGGASMQWELLDCGNNLFAEETEGSSVYLSTNNGTNWIAVKNELPPFPVTLLASAGNGAFVAETKGGGIYVSTSNGTHWTSANAGLTDSIIYSLALNDSTVFASTGSGIVWRRPLSEMLGVISDKSRQSRLTQASLQIRSVGSGPILYIDFSLPRPDKVAVTIFDISGRQVTSLVNDNFGSGAHSVPWNTRTVAPGYYMVRMRTGSEDIEKGVPIVRWFAFSE